MYKKFQKFIELKILCSSMSNAIFIVFTIFLFSNAQSAAANPCITYDSANNLIIVTCNSASLTYIDNQLNDDTVLDKEQQSNGVWLILQILHG
jgi:hypothetical protein